MVVNSVKIKLTENLLLLNLSLPRIEDLHVLEDLPHGLLHSLPLVLIMHQMLAEYLLSHL
jgi:hypothetical protein